MFKRINFIALSALAIAIVTVMSCKKVLNKPDGGGSTRTALQLTMDSLYFYAHQLYYWNNYLPGYNSFNPHQYATGNGTDSAQIQNELYALTVTDNIAINQTTGRSYEYYAYDSTNPGDMAGPKYSYFFTTSANGTTSAINEDDLLNGSDDGFGFYAGLWANDTAIIRYVIKGSPFDIAGIKRGDRIVSVNGTQMTNLYANNLNNDPVNLLNSMSSGSFTGTAKVVVQHHVLSNTTGVTDTLNISYSSRYTYNPVFKDTIINNGTESVGYVSYWIFSDSASSSKQALSNVFAKFNAANVSDLVIDLRYNGGGYVNTSEYFTNLIAPSSVGNGIMHIAYYNDTMTSGKASLLALQKYSTSGEYWSASNQTTYFNKAVGGLTNLKRVFFLVSGGTASASELLINSLSPYITTYLIGTYWNYQEENGGIYTYGKPVGFFPIKINKFTFYIPEFATKNKDGFGDYYNGLKSNNQVFDDATHDFGDPNEYGFKQALYYIKNGNFSSAISRVENRSLLQVSQQKQALRKPRTFNGMIRSTRK